MTRAFIGLGTNLGNRLLNLAEARRRLADVGALTKGPVVESEALLPEEDRTPQPRYLNAVDALDTRLSAHELFTELKKIEHQMGRRRTTRWAPRLIDLDLLRFGDEVVNTPALTVPHPAMQERAFVLIPLRVLQAQLSRAPGSTPAQPRTPRTPGRSRR